MKIPEKVFIVGRPHPDSFVRNVAVTLENMGSKVATLPPLPGKAYKSQLLVFANDMAERLLPAWKRWHLSKVVSLVRQFKPDLVLTLTRELDFEAVEEIRHHTQALIVHWYTDSLANLGREEIVTNSYDAVFLKDPETAKRLSCLLGDRFYYLPEAMNPLWHKPVESSPRYQCDVGIAGNIYPYRCRILERLSNYNIKIWGPAPPRWLKSPVLRFYTGEYVAEHTKALAFSSASVSLNTLSLKEGNTINCRAFEIAGCGGYHVMEYRPIVSEAFEPGKEVMLYQCFDSLREHIERGLRDRSFNQRLREAAAARARAEHTYEHRLRAMFKILYT